MAKDAGKKKLGGKKKVIKLTVKAKPKAATKPRTAKPKAAKSGPKGGNSFVLHGHHSGDVPTVTHNGTAVPHPDVVRYDVNILPTEKVLAFCTNVGSSGSAMLLLKWDPASGIVSVNTVRTPTLLQASGVAGGPTSMRAMKMSLSLTNATQYLNRGGRVYVLNSDQRFAFPASVALCNASDWNNIFNAVVEHPNTVPYDGTHFGETGTYTCSVVDGPSYERFEENDGAEAVDAFGAHIASWTGSAHRVRPMSCIVMAFETPAITQSYTFSAVGKWYTRWPLATVPGRMMTPIPTASPAEVNRILVQAEAKAHQSVRFGSGTG